MGRALPARASKPRGSEAFGFTLIEPMVTVVLAGVVFAAMVPLFLNVQQKASADRMRTAALNVAHEPPRVQQDRLEKIRRLDFSQITLANLQSPTFAGGQFGTTWTSCSGSGSEDSTITYDVQNVGGSGGVPAYLTVRSG